MGAHPQKVASDHQHAADDIEPAQSDLEVMHSAPPQSILGETVSQGHKTRGKKVEEL
jgi:hypothetical protein